MHVDFLIEVPKAADRKRIELALSQVLDRRAGDWFVSVIEPRDAADWHVRVQGPNGLTWSDVSHDRNASSIASRLERALEPVMGSIHSLQIRGFGPFKATALELRPLEILVGANGTGKTSLFEFLRAIREFVRVEVPPEIVPGWETREVYHRPGPDRMAWEAHIRFGTRETHFDAEIVGPIGNPVVAAETVQVFENGSIAHLDRRGEIAWISDSTGGRTRENATDVRQQRLNQLVLKSYVTPSYPALYELRTFVEAWRFFSGIRLNDRQLRQPALVEENPSLREDGGNLASVLNWLQTENRTVFNEIETHIRGIIPGFRGLEVRASGTGRVTLFWNEDGLISPLSAADLSDGTLRFLMWVTLALTPNAPSLVCIDEPEVGLHPRALPKIAGLLKKLSDRTQVVVATHSSYLLAQFDLSDIVIFRKTDDGIDVFRPANSQALVENLKDFGTDEIELMHRSDELEALT